MDIKKKVLIYILIYLNSLKKLKNKYNVPLSIEFLNKFENDENKNLEELSLRIIKTVLSIEQEEDDINVEEDIENKELMSNYINDNNGNKNDEEQIKENDGGNIIMEGKNFFDVDIRKKTKLKVLPILKL